MVLITLKFKNDFRKLELSNPKRDTYYPFAKGIRGESLLCSTIAKYVGLCPFLYAVSAPVWRSYTHTRACAFPAPNKTTDLNAFVNYKQPCVSDKPICWLKFCVCVRQTRVGTEYLIRWIFNFTWYFHEWFFIILRRQILSLLLYYYGSTAVIKSLLLVLWVCSRLHWNETCAWPSIQTSQLTCCWKAKDRSVWTRWIEHTITMCAFNN